MNLIKRGDTVYYTRDKNQTPMTSISDPEPYGTRQVITCKWKPPGRKRGGGLEYGLFDVAGLTKEKRCQQQQ